MPSPIKAPELLVDFPTAVKAVIEGHRITKLEWKDKEPSAYGMLRDGFLMLWTKGEWHTWTVSEGDLVGQDWVVLG